VKKWRVNWRVPDQRGLREVVQKDCQACKLEREDAMDHKMRTLIKDD